MIFNRKKQIMAGLVSVVVLTVVAGATFVSRFGTHLISADVSRTTQAPTLSFFPAFQSVKPNQEVGLTLNGDFRKQAITGGTITFNFDPEKLEVKSVITEDLILDKSILEEIDNEGGTVKLIFLPNTGVASQGDIAELKLLSKATGIANVSFEETGAENNLQPTSLSSPTEEIVFPDLVNSVVNIED